MERKILLLFFAFLIVFVDTVGYQIVIPSLPLFAEKLSLTESNTGIIYASYGFASLLLYIPFGYLVDRFGKVIFIFCGLFLLGISSLLFASAETFYGLLLSRTLQGISASSTWSGIIPFVANVTEREKRGIGMAGIGIAYSMGSIIGPAFGGIGGLRTPFVLFSIFPFVLFVLFFLLSRTDDAPEGNVGKFNIQQIFKSRGLLIACISIFACFFAIGAMEVLLPLHLYEFNINKAKIGIGFAALGFFSAGFQVLAGWWSDRRGRIEPIVAGLILATFLIPFLGMVKDIKFLLVLFVPLAFSFASALAPTLPLIADSIPQKNLGIAYGIYNTVFSLGLIAGSVFLTLLSQGYGLKSVLFLLSGIMLVSACVAYLFKHPSFSLR